MSFQTVFISADDGSLCGGVETLRDREAYEMHNYYPSIADLTFQTAFVPLSIEDARVWRLYYSGKCSTMSDADKIIYESFLNRISSAIESMHSKAGVFVKLSTRSPKDAPPLLPRTKILTCLQKHLSNLLCPREIRSLASNSPLPVQIQLLAIRRAMFELMRISRTDEAIELLSLSGRVISDMKRALDYVDSVPWHMQLIVREFVPLRPELEMRCFVFEKRLVSASQYCTDVYVPELASSNCKEILRAKLQCYFDDKIIPRIDQLSN
jgi:hypothetical protein